MVTYTCSALQRDSHAGVRQRFQGKGDGIWPRAPAHSLTHSFIQQTLPGTCMARPCAQEAQEGSERHRACLTEI